MADWPYNTTAWQRLRQRKLAENTLCEFCIPRGRLVPAFHVDHNVPINQGGPAFPPLDELTSLCASCHSVKTNTVDAGRPMKGCTLDGSPADGSHPFHEDRD